MDYGTLYIIRFVSVKLSVDQNNGAKGSQLGTFARRQLCTVALNSNFTIL